MRKLFLLLIPTILFAQAQGYDPRKALDKLQAKAIGHYGAFSVTKIPRSCAHPHSLFGVKTCRIYVKYPSVMPKPVFFIEDWTDPNEADHSKGNDTIYHVALYKPDAQGVYIEGIPGHRIWWQVNSR